MRIIQARRVESTVGAEDLFYFEDRIESAERIGFGGFIVWVLLPLSVDYEAVSVSALR